MKIEVQYDGGNFPHPYHAYWTDHRGEERHVDARTFDELVSVVYGLSGLVIHFALETR